MESHDTSFQPAVRFVGAIDVVSGTLTIEDEAYFGYNGAGGNGGETSRGWSWFEHDEAACGAPPYEIE